MIEFYVYELLPFVVDDAVRLCENNPAFRAGIFYTSYDEYRSLESYIGQTVEESVPWIIEEMSAASGRIIVKFENESVLEVFSTSSTLRGRRYHHLVASKNTPLDFQRSALMPLVRNYGPDTTDDYLESLLAFAEEVVGKPLPAWQRDMLTCMAKDKLYITSRSAGKKATADIYEKWIKEGKYGENPPIIPEISLTYEQLMAFSDENSTKIADKTVI